MIFSERKPSSSWETFLDLFSHTPAKLCYSRSMLCHTCNAAIGYTWSKQTGFEKPQPLTCPSKVIVFLPALFLAFLQVFRAGCGKSLLCFLGNLKTYMATNSKDWGRGKDIHLYAVNFSRLALKTTWVCSFGAQGLCKSHCYVWLLEETCSFRDLGVGSQKQRFSFCNYYCSWFSGILFSEQ